jgi:hypothetical protein
MTFSAPDSTQPAASAAAGERAIYVYGFVDAARLDGSRPPLAADQALVLHRVGGNGAMIREVPAADFCGGDAERNLADPAWLMPRIRHHESVVEDAMQCSPVFPLGFATLYRSIDTLTGFMRRHEAAILGFLRRVDGEQEWALKVTAELDDPAALDALAMELWPSWSGDPPGLRYLRVRQARPELLKAAAARAARLTSGIVDALRPLATSIRPLRRATAAPGADRQHTEDHAVLAAAARRAALHERLNALAAAPDHQCLRITLSGPWPPYSFRPLLHDSCPEHGG